MMNKYSIILSDNAKYDIDSSFEYIFYNLKNPNAAINFKNNIIAKMKSLQYMPSRNPVIERQKYNAKDVHKALLDNYLILYIIDDEKYIVNIIRVAHSRRAISQLLK